MQQKKHGIRLAVLLLLVLLGLAAVGLGQSRSTGPRALPAVASQVPQGSPFQVTVYGHGAIQTVLPWWDDATGDYRLFLPGWARPDRLELSLGRVRSLTIGGEPVPRSGFFTLEPGRWPMTWQGQAEPCDLVVYQVPEGMASLFLQLDGPLCQLLREPRRPLSGTMELYDAAGHLDSRGGLALTGRGNSSWTEAEKKPFALHLDAAEDLLGMGKARRWQLMANGLDPSQMRNTVVHQLAAGAGMAYTPRMEYLQLYVNGSYQGLYQLSQKVQVHKSRVEIRDQQAENEALNPGLHFELLKKKLTGFWAAPGSAVWYQLPREPEDVSGGYLIELDMEYRSTNEPSFFCTQRGQFVSVLSPKYATQRQSDTIRSLYQSVENAAFSPDGIDPETGLPLSELIDLPSFADKYLIEEISKNGDSVMSSQFFYKPEDAVSTRLHAGPVWDYDFALASQHEMVCTEESQSPEGFCLAEGEHLWPQLYRQPVFRQEVQQRFHELFVPELARLTEGGLTAQGQALAPYAVADAARWGQRDPEAARAEYLAQVEYIREFLARRTQWLCSQWPRP